MLDYVPNKYWYTYTVEEKIAASASAVLHGEIGAWRSKSDSTVEIPEDMLRRYYEWYG